MKEFCYVIINNAGFSWAALAATDTTPPSDQNAAPALPKLLQDGWVPVRETPMGGGTSSLAHSLILLEKNTPKPKAPRATKSAR